MKSTIAAVLIVKNEADNLDKCLSSVKEWVDEIIILDSGSTDQTQQIAEKYGAKFYQNSDWQGFGIQRQRAQTYVTSDWCLWLDADEIVTAPLRKNIEALLTQPIQSIAYTIPRLNHVFGKPIHHSGWYPDRVIRLYPTQLTGYNDALVHEKVQIDQAVKLHDLSGDLLHTPYKNLEHYLVKSAGYAKAWADSRELKGKSTTITTGFLHAMGCFCRMYLLRLGFLDGKTGLLLSVLSAHSTFVKYADLWIRKQKS